MSQAIDQEELEGLPRFEVVVVVVTLPPLPLEGHAPHPALLVALARGTQIGEPVMTVMTAEQTGCAGAAWARAMKDMEQLREGARRTPCTSRTFREHHVSGRTRTAPRAALLASSA